MFVALLKCHCRAKTAKVASPFWRKMQKAYPVDRGRPVGELPLEIRVQNTVIFRAYW